MTAGSFESTVFQLALTKACPLKNRNQAASASNFDRHAMIRHRAIFWRTGLKGVMTETDARV
jgi:hypothetical protein